MELGVLFGEGAVTGVTSGQGVFGGTRGVFYGGFGASGFWMGVGFCCGEVRG